MIQEKVIPAVLMESLAYRDFAKDAYTDLPDSDDLDEVCGAAGIAAKQQAQHTSRTV
ncbi:MAG: hypothetical protein ACLUOF_11445 [Ruminococcus sp.]